MTNEKFISIPNHLTYKANTHDISRIYKTGDFGRWLENGEIDLLGRMDFQVKVRGHRIELTEIEKQLLTCDGISQCVVVVNKTIPSESNTLVAYYVSHSSIEPLSLKNYAAKKLPSYMIPDIFTPVKEMPLTRSGKIDRNALSEQSIEQTSVSITDLPQTDVEIILANIYCSLLNINEVGTSENFFDIGGHSINAMQLLARINKAFGTSITLKSIFDHGKIADLSRYIESHKNVEIF